MYHIASCIAQLSLIFFSHSANWSADTHRWNSEYCLLSDKRTSVLKYDFIYQSHLSVSFNYDRPTARMSFQKYYDQTQYANFCKKKKISRHLVLNFIISKLYTTSLLSSLNSRRGGGYDTSENNDAGFGLSTDLGLRFASNSQLADDRRTSVAINTPPVSPLIHFPITMG